MWNSIYMRDEIGETIGELEYDHDTIISIYIHPLYRRKGYGRKLLQLGIQKIQSKLVKVSSNSTSRGFYLKCGFKEYIGTEKDKELGITHYLVKNIILPKTQQN